ncbi:MAG: ATP-binding protein [Oligoflexia bacterium]|nr:ATP-binding protein [Oligoflexia bacterium]
MQYYRDFSEKIKLLSESFPAIVLTGARQTGKTTILKETFKTYNYVSLDSYADAELAENDPQRFLASNPPPLIIDEIQYAPKLFRHLKKFIDADREKKGQYLLTGSQKFTLMKNVSDSLAGRCVWLELETLSCREISQMQGQFSDYGKQLLYLSRGGFPELWKDTGIPYRDFYRTYLATYIERDVRQIINITKLRDFERFIRLCATRNAQLINKTDIAKEVGVTLQTINEWLSALEASNQIFLLEPYYQSLEKRIIKTPKLYFADTGLLCYLLDIDEKSLSASAYIGGIWEAFIYSELRKIIAVNSLNRHLYFYRDKEGREIDFMVTGDNKVLLLECKWTQSPNPGDSKWLKHVEELFLKKSKLTPSGNFVVCRTEKSYSLPDKTEVINGFDKLNSIIA